MAYTPSLKNYEDAFNDVNGLESNLGNLDTDLVNFNTLVAKIDTISFPFPKNIVNDLTTFYAGLQEVDSMIKDLDKITLEKLQDILTDAETGIETLINPIPAILTNLKSISTLFPTIQKEIEGITGATGLDASIKSLNAQMKSWSNTDPRTTAGETGTGVLNAVYYEMLVAIKDNNMLKNKYDTSVGNIATQLNTLGTNLDTPVATLNTNASNFDAQIKSVNTYLTTYSTALSAVSELSAKVEKVVALLDTFKPDVDLVYGIVQPLSWFIELIESKTCPSASASAPHISDRTERLNFYFDSSATVASKFQQFEQAIYIYFETNNIGQKIMNAVESMLPITALQTAAQDLNTSLVALSKDQSISTIQANIKTVNGNVGQVETELKVLSTTAVKATGTVQFSRTMESSAATIGKGTYVQDSISQLIYVTTADATFAASSLDSNTVPCTALAVGTAANVDANAVNTFVSTLVKQSDGTYQRSPNPVYGDNFSVNTSSAFSGGTAMSIGEIQTEANDLAKQMLPTLMRLMN